MSNGFCQTHCQGSYVFAVIQGENCWCSNEQPANTVPTANCNEQCPGYPADTCGNPGRGYFAYFNLGGSPTGTYGGSSPSSSRAPSSSPVSTFVPATTFSVASSSTGRSRSSWTFSSSVSPSSRVVSFLTSSVVLQTSAQLSTSSLAPLSDPETDPGTIYSTTVSAASLQSPIQPLRRMISRVCTVPESVVANLCLHNIFQTVLT